MKVTEVRMKTLILFLIMLISISAYSQEKQFQKACKKNTLESYEKFINKYPNSEFTEEATYRNVELVNTSSGYEYFLSQYPTGEFSEEAMTILCKLEYSEIEATENIDNYKEYLKRFPDCKDFSQRAKTRLIELEYKEALSKNTIVAFEYFLNHYSDNEYSVKAEKMIQQIEFEQVKKENSLESFTSFINKYPGNDLSKEAQLLIEKIEFNQAIEINSSESYTQFINKYPGSKYSFPARRKIEEIEYYDAKKSGSIFHLLEFLQEYPNSNYTSQINKDIQNNINQRIKTFVIPSNPRTKLILSRIKAKIPKNSLFSDKNVIYIYGGNEGFSKIDSIASLTYKKGIGMIKGTTKVLGPLSRISGNIKSQSKSLAPLICNDRVLIFGKGFGFWASGNFITNDQLKIELNKLSITYLNASVVFGFSGGAVVQTFNKASKIKIVDCPFQLSLSAGVIHVIIGELELQNYEFQSDITDPLTFRLSVDGYIYLRGKGKIIDTLNNQEWIMN